MRVVDDSFNHPLALEEHATMPMAGGLEQMGFQCGQLWGAALAAGAEAYRQFGPGPRAEAAAVVAAQRLADCFQTSYKSINCFEVVERFQGCCQNRSNMVQSSQPHPISERA